MRLNSEAPAQGRGGGGRGGVGFAGTGLKTVKSAESVNFHSHAFQLFAPAQVW